MKNITYTFALAAIVLSSGVQAAGEKDCLLQGKVIHDASGQNASTVKIHSISGYDDNSRCKVRKGEKVEFKLPSDSRVEQAPSGSEVKYRYQSDGKGSDRSELISVGT